MTTEHAYTVGRIRALETRMLDEGKIIRMAEAADFESAFSVLNESIYAQHFDKLTHPFDFEELLKLELESVKKLLHKLAPDIEQAQTAFSKKWTKIYAELMEIKVALRTKPETAESLVNKYRYRDYARVIEEGINAYLQNKSFSMLEKLMDDFLIEQFKKTKYFSFGIEPLIGFLLAKEYEIKNIRLILTCKKNHIPTEKIKERLRMVYV